MGFPQRIDDQDFLDVLDEAQEAYLAELAATDNEPQGATPAEATSDDSEAE